jgi:hypothetical protein
MARAMRSGHRRRGGGGLMAFILLAVLVVGAAIAWTAYRDGAFEDPRPISMDFDAPSLPQPSLPDVEPPSVPSTPPPPAPIG